MNQTVGEWDNQRTKPYEYIFFIIIWLGISTSCDSQPVVTYLVDRDGMKTHNSNTIMNFKNGKERKRRRRRRGRQSISTSSIFRFSFSVAYDTSPPSSLRISIHAEPSLSIVVFPSFSCFFSFFHFEYLFLPLFRFTSKFMYKII